MDTLGWIELLNLLVLGLLMGGETGLLLGTHPALARLPQETQIVAMRAVCRRYRIAQPALAVAGLATATAATIGLLMVERPFWLGGIGWLCLAGHVAILFRFLRPLDFQLSTFPDGGHDWAGIGRRWQLWHVATAVLGAIAFAMFVVAGVID